MAKKKPLVEDARKGLDALKQHMFQQIREQEPHSYREKFRSLARERIGFKRPNDDDSDPKPHSNH